MLTFGGSCMTSVKEEEEQLRNRGVVLLNQELLV